MQPLDHIDIDQYCQRKMSFAEFSNAANHMAICSECSEKVREKKQFEAVFADFEKELLVVPQE